MTKVFFGLLLLLASSILPTVPSRAQVVPATSAVTLTEGSPGVVGWPAHGLAANDTVYFCTTGQLPAQLAPCVPGTGAVNGELKTNPALYFVYGPSIAPDTFEVSATPGGPPIDLTGPQSGAQTAFANVFAAPGSVGEYLFNVTEYEEVAAPSGPDTVYNKGVFLPPGIWTVGGQGGVYGKAAVPPAPSIVFDTNHASLGLGVTGICSSPYCGTTAVHVTSNNSNGWMFTFDPKTVAVFPPGATLQSVCEPVYNQPSGAYCYGSEWAVRQR